MPIPVYLSDEQKRIFRMECFDALPRELRDYLNTDTTRHISPVFVRDRLDYLMRYGLTEDEAIVEVKAWLVQVELDLAGKKV